ncbi:MAG: hypothetical protein F7B06_04975, partial [Opitutae bacterium]|nr:hypothetical protein [Opitutae bacterium]
MSLPNWFIRLLGNLLPVATYRRLPRETPEGITFCLDGPDKLRPQQREFLFQGWCYSNQQRIKAMRIITHAGRQKVRYGIERRDLLQAFQTRSDSVLYAGFEAPMTLPPGPTRFTLEAQMEDGSWRPIITEYFIRPLLTIFHRENLGKSLHPFVPWRFIRLLGYFLPLSTYR